MSEKEINFKIDEKYLEKNTENVVLDRLLVSQKLTLYKFLRLYYKTFQKFENVM